MRLVDVRSTHPEQGLVAVLVEDRGPAMLAVPVTARQGLALRAHRIGRSPSWAHLIEDLIAALGARARVLLDVDADARITASLRLEYEDPAAAPVQVPCDPGDGLVVACAQSLALEASQELVRLRAVDLTADLSGDLAADLAGGLMGGQPEEWLDELDASTLRDLLRGASDTGSPRDTRDT